MQNVWWLMEIPATFVEGNIEDALLIFLDATLTAPEI